MPKIAMIGAGSVVFAKRLTTDILSWPELSDSTFVFVDRHLDRAELTRDIAGHLIRQQNLQAKVLATTDRREALDGADYVVVMIQVGGAEATAPDRDIPLRYGVDQAIGDTLGPGGVFRALRTIPEIVDIARDMEELCPKALLINYSNPMPMVCGAINEATSIRSIGFCHSVQITTEQLFGYMNLPFEQANVWVAGINHMAWFLKLECGHEDVYPKLWQAMEDPEIFAKDSIRFEIMRYFDYFVTESTNHMSEYVPYFRKRPEVISEYGLRSAKNRSGFDEKRASRMEVNRRQATGQEQIPFERTNEFCSYLIHAEVTNTPFRVNGNVKNFGYITNLPEGCVVEVPILVDGTGLHPCHVGDLPIQLAALNRTNVNVHQLTVKAALECDRKAARMAIQADPLTAAVCTLPEIKQMTDELFVASAPWLKF